MGPGRVRFAFEVVLDMEDRDFDGGSSWRPGLREPRAEGRCAAKLPMTEYLGMGVYGVAAVWACPPCTSAQVVWHTI